MKILILSAMDKEQNLISSLMDNKTCLTVDGIDVFAGEFSHHEIYSAKCGIGKVNAAVNTLRLIKTLEPDLVVNSGVAGGAGIPVGSILIPDRVAYYDVWCGPGTEYGQADGSPLFFIPSEIVISKARELTEIGSICIGLICTGDKFVSTPEEIAFIRSHFPDAKGVDMESAAIAQVCFQENIPFNIVRVVSDTPGEGENISQYQNFWSEAPVKTFNVVKRLIGSLE